MKKIIDENCQKKKNCLTVIKMNIVTNICVIQRGDNSLGPIGLWHIQGQTGLL